MGLAPRSYSRGYSVRYLGHDTAPTPSPRIEPIVDNPRRGRYVKAVRTHAGSADDDLHSQHVAVRFLEGVLSAAMASEGAVQKA